MSDIQRIKDEINHHEDSLEELRIELIMKLVLKEYNAAKEWDVCKEYNADTNYINSWSLAEQEDF